MPDKLNGKLHVLKGGNEEITSYFGLRTDPVTGEKEVTHGGIDLISGIRNRTVVAVADGTVVTTRNSYSGRTKDGSAGNYITLDHGGGVETKYKHLKQHTLKVKVGQKVKAGQALATMGDTGHATGVHLHFDVVQNGTRVDPLPYLRGDKTLLPTVQGNRGDKPTLRWGKAKTAECKALMVWLNQNKNARILADGNPGNRTYQYAKKLTVKKNVDGYPSQWVQGRLKTMGFYKGAVDGEPRSLTDKAIRAFQRAYGLAEDGKVSGTDWYYLLAWEG